MSDGPVVVIGAGLAGLACARTLHRAGVTPVVLEAGDAPGGRVRTDRVDGFLVDRGFQVLLDSYPEAQAQLDLPALGLGGFEAGATVRHSGRWATVVDPWRAPLRAPLNLLGDVFTLGDAWRMLSLRRLLAAAAPSAARPEAARALEGVRTADLIGELGFSRQAMDRFFRPFFGGVFLDPSLSPGADFFAFVFTMFARGRATLPRLGMGAIPAQMATGLPAGALRLRTGVRAVEARRVVLEDGSAIDAARVVIATGAEVAEGLLHRAPSQLWNSCVTFSYDAAELPRQLRGPVLCLNGNGRSSGPINHVCAPSAVQPSYAPAGRHLVSATVLGAESTPITSLEAAGRIQMLRWFGPVVRDWRLLRADEVRHALPRRWPPLAQRDALVRLGEGRYACGDWLEGPSIDAALRSGRRAAEAVLTDLGLTTGTRAA